MSSPYPLRLDAVNRMPAAAFVDRFGDLAEQLVEVLIALPRADLLQEDAGQGVVGLGEEGVGLVSQRVY